MRRWPPGLVGLSPRGPRCRISAAACARASVQRQRGAEGLWLRPLRLARDLARRILRVLQRRSTCPAASCAREQQWARGVAQVQYGQRLGIGRRASARIAPRQCQLAASVLTIAGGDAVPGESLQGLGQSRQSRAADSSRAAVAPQGHSAGTGCWRQSRRSSRRARPAASPLVVEGQAPRGSGLQAVSRGVEEIDGRDAGAGIELGYGQHLVMPLGGRLQLASQEVAERPVVGVAT